MKVLVTGASGALGAALLARPAASQHRVRGASRSPDWVRSAPDRVRLDVRSGEGLERALDGVQAVIHAASAPRGDTAATDVDGTRRLAAAAARAGVRHLVYVSIVGVDRIPLDYYRHKLAAEQAVAAGGVPWTVVRATQFHGFVDVLCHRLARLPGGMAPRGWRVQPVDVGVVADALWDVVERGPLGRAPDVAGPEVLTWQAVAAAWWKARGRPRRVWGVPVPGALSRTLRQGWATAPDRAGGGPSWDAWVTARYREAEAVPDVAVPAAG